MKIAIIGNTGFLGGNLTQHLLLTEHELHLVSRSNTNESKGNVHYYRCDLSETDRLVDIVADCDYLYFLAGESVPSGSQYNLQENINFNLSSPLCFFEKLSQLDKKPIIINVSSGGTVYGDTDEAFISEAHATNPISFYGLTKLCAEKYLNQLAMMGNIEHVNLRLANPYGPGMKDKATPQGIVHFMFDAYKHGKKFQVWGDGSMIRDYIYIDDVCQVFSKMYETPKVKLIGKTLNLGSGIGYSINQLVEIFHKQMHEQLTIEYLKGNTIGHVQRYVLDISLLSDLVGWQPNISMPMGIEKMKDYYDVE